jgi:glycosyltransferase involved in cell wall biosynthesis
MRIALDASYSVDTQPSGIAIYSQELMRGLPALHETDQYYFCYRPKQWRRHLELPLPNIQRRLLQWPLPVGKVDLFHGLNQRLDRRLAPAVVTTFHDLFVMTAEYSSAEFRTRFTKQAREAAERSDLIIAVSRFTANQVRDLLHIPESRIRVVPHGVHHLQLNFDIPREKIILFVGTLQLRKNIGRLVQAFEEVSSEWRLVLAGAPGGYGSVEIMAGIDNSPARSRIHLAGYLTHSALERMFARASVFAFPSLDEGFGIPVLEAMAHGVPVLTSNRSGLLEAAGDAALLVSPDNLDDLVAGLRRMTEDPDLRERLAIKGKEHAARFRWSDTVYRTHKLYRELVHHD